MTSPLNKDPQKEPTAHENELIAAHAAGYSMGVKTNKRLADPMVSLAINLVLLAMLVFLPERLSDLVFVGWISVLVYQFWLLFRARAAWIKARDNFEKARASWAKESRRSDAD